MDLGVVVAGGLVFVLLGLALRRYRPGEAPNRIAAARIGARSARTVLASPRGARGWRRLFGLPHDVAPESRLGPEAGRSVSCVCTDDRGIGRPRRHVGDRRPGAAAGLRRHHVGLHRPLPRAVGRGARGAHLLRPADGGDAADARPAHRAAALHGPARRRRQGRGGTGACRRVWILEFGGAAVGLLVLLGAAASGASPQAAWVFAGITAAAAIMHGVPSSLLRGLQHWRAAGSWASRPAPRRSC